MATTNMSRDANRRETSACPLCGDERHREKPLLLPVPEVAHLLGICEKFTWDLLKEGELSAITLGRRKLVLRSSIEDLITRRLAENDGGMARKGHTVDAKEG